VYRLTAAGHAELTAWMHAGVHGEHVRDAFYVKLLVALATAGVDPRDVVRTQRTTLYRDLHALTARRGAVARSEHLTRAMLLDKAVMHLEADLRWLDMVEGRLAEMERQPLPMTAPRRRGRPPKEHAARADQGFAQEPHGPPETAAAG
jgi:hypothetical protein